MKAILVVLGIAFLVLSVPKSLLREEGVWWLAMIGGALIAIAFGFDL